MKIAVKSINVAPADLPDDDAELDEMEAGAPAPEQSAVEPIVLQLTPADQGERMDKVLSSHLTQYSRSRLQQWLGTGHIQVDGQPTSVRQTVLGDEVVTVWPQAAPEEGAYHPEAMTLDIVHEDADILVINKPAGLVVHPAVGNWSGTLLNGLLAYLPAIAGVPRAGIVHRLDKDTSGLMVVAKTMEAHTMLVRQLQAHTVERNYVALVWGEPNASGRIDAAIGRHSRDRKKMAVSQHLGAKRAVTHFQTIAEGMLGSRPVSLVHCQLETGRTHQIRVHMQSIGHPLVGDPVYGKGHLIAAFPRQALHARRLGLVHPGTGKTMRWQVMPPMDMVALLENAGLAEELGGN